MTDAVKFREYVTSGAFKMSLSRQQISALSMIAETGKTACGGHTFGALYNKGLVEHIRAENGQLEYRLTEAGVFALKLVRLAELANGDADPVSLELSALRSQLNETRVIAQQMAADLWDMKARLQQAEHRVAEAKALVRKEPLPARPMVTLKNKHPERSVADMIAHLEIAEAQISEASP